MWSVFILYENGLFARGLEKLLRQEGVKVVGSAMRVRQMIEQVRKLDPDVVIAEVEHEKPDAGTLLARLLGEHSRAALVRMSLDNNSATIYTGQRWTANTAEALVKGILNSVSGVKGAHRHGSA